MDLQKLINRESIAQCRWQRVAPKVFTARIFSKAQCQAILDAIESQSSRHPEGLGQPNSMHEYGIVLEEDGLTSAAKYLVEEALGPSIQTLFGELPHLNFSEHHAFLTLYGANANSYLSLHVDASHITLNVCLYTDAEGADLVFTGNRCGKHLDDAPEAHLNTFKFVQGDALLHLGNQRHYVSPVLNGQRKNLIIWSRLNNEVCDHTNPWMAAECPACLRSIRLNR